MTKLLGVIGGMGPGATHYFLKICCDLTQAESDQDHIPVVTYSNTLIPDRTTALLSNQRDPVTNALIKTAQSIEKLGVDYLVMPCNTAHAWFDEISGAISTPFINMVDETIQHIRQRQQRVLLLATQGTYYANVYQSAIDEGLVMLPNSSQKEDCMQAILDIKSNCLNSSACQNVLSWSQDYLHHDIDAILLGCTELPLLFGQCDTPTIDPMQCLAKKVIDCFDRTVRSDLVDL